MTLFSVSNCFEIIDWYHFGHCSDFWIDHTSLRVKRIKPKRDRVCVKQKRWQKVGKVFGATDLHFLKVIPNSLSAIILYLLGLMTISTPSSPLILFMAPLYISFYSFFLMALLQLYFWFWIFLLISILAFDFSSCFWYGFVLVLAMNMKILSVLSFVYLNEANLIVFFLVFY